MRNEKANSLLNWLFVYSAAGLQITAELTVFLNPSELMQLSEEERQTLYTMLDAFVGKKKLKDTLSTVLNDMK
ncbi:MAG: hypothetical protein KDB74_12770 [Flavobacteriales bacterium]|nr:hypothetical protein [Flavobacteriales bacterium]